MTDDPKIYSEEYYKLIYDMEEKHWWCRGMRTIAAGVLDKHFNPQSNIRVLDAGCGTGLLLEWLERYSAKKIIGIDVSMHALKYCRDRQHSTISQASVVNCPFLSESFHLVTCNDVLQHVPALDVEILKEFYRILTAGGFLYLRTNAMQRFESNDDPEAEYHRYSLEEVKEKGRAAGFENVLATYTNSFPSLIADAKNLFKAKRNQTHAESSHHGAYKGLTMRMPPFGLNTLLYTMLKGEAFFINKNGKLPFGHSLVFLFKKPKESIG